MYKDERTWFLIENRSTHEWITESYVGRSLTVDANEALAFPSYDDAKEYLIEMNDPMYDVTQHIFSTLK